MAKAEKIDAVSNSVFKKVPVIEQVRRELKKMKAGDEVSYKNFKTIKDAKNALNMLENNEELEFEEMRKDATGGRPYKVWKITGNEKPTVTKRKPVYNKQASQLGIDPDYKLLCGRSISSLPKGAVIVHRLMG